MKQYTEKSINKRKEERKDFPDFYKKHTEIIKNNKECCKECGVRLLGDISEVAHILNKSYFKSVSTNDDNVIYLCGWKQNNCHDKFDSGKEKEMKVFSIAKEKFDILKEEVKEKINYKIWDKYGN
jgi:hypothetical protein